jgi:hypothetical protein
LIKKILLITYYIVYLLFYAGFIFVHPSLKKFAFIYSILLSILFLGFIVPLIINRLIRKYGRRKILFSAIPSIILLLFVYLLFSIKYYYTQQHLFDPFLQIHPPAVAPDDFKEPDNSYRILALGGSTTRNIRVSPEERYPSILKSILQKAYPQINIEIFNAGQEWYTIKHSLINYVSNMRNWQPDLVIVMHAINDLVRSFSPPRFAITPYRRSWSHFYGPSAKGAKPPSFEHYLFLERFQQIWYSKFRLLERDFPLQRYQSLEEYQRYLHSLLHYVKSDSVDIIVMTQPYFYKNDMIQEELSMLWFPFKMCNQRLNMFQKEFPSVNSMQRAMASFNKVTLETTRRENAILIDLEIQIAKNLTNFVDDVHYTSHGTDQIANIIARRIIQEGLIERAMVKNK